MKKHLTALAFAALATAFTAAPGYAQTADDVIAQHTCAPGQTMRVITGGTEDNYGGGTEAATPRWNLANSAHVANYQASLGNTSLRQYDQGGNNNFFMETLMSLKPGTKTAHSGVVVLKMKTTGGQFDTDSILLGDLRKHGASMGIDHSNYGAWLPITMVGWANNNGMYSADLSSLMVVDGSRSLLDFIQTQNQIDIVLQDDAEIDYIKFGICIS